MVAGVRVPTFLFLMLVIVALSFLAQGFLSDPGKTSAAEPVPANAQQ